MKRFLLFISSILFFSPSQSQNIDSIKVSVGESNQEEDGWFFKTLYVDSFSSGSRKSFLTRIWQANDWVNSSLNSFSYDTSGNLSESTFQNWDGIQWVNSVKWVHTYNASNILLEKLIEQWDGTNWINKSLETHSLDANGNDTLILYSAWRNNAWDDSEKTERIFNGLSFLISQTSSVWDTTMSVWNFTSQYLHSPDSAGRDSSVTYRFWSNGQWRNSDMSSYIYNALGQTMIYNEYWWTDTAWWFVTQTSYSYNVLHQLTGYSWDCFYGACGPASGDYQYDNNGNLIYSHSYSETMGGIPNEYRWHYYYFGYPASPQLYINTVQDFVKCSADTTLIGAFAFGGIPPLHFQWTPASGLSSDTLLNPFVFTDSSRTYILTVNDSSGNSSSDTLNITVVPSPVANISIQSVDTSSLCNSAMLVTDSLEHIYCTWYFNGSQQYNFYGNGAAHLSIDENGLYNVRVVNIYSCSAADDISVNIFPHPAPAITVVTHCNTLEAQASGVQSYQWYKNYVVIQGAITDSLFIDSNDTYFVVITDSNGCTNMSSPQFFRPWYAGFGVHYACHDTCNGELHGSAVWGTSPYTYQWSTGATTQNVTNVCAGVYTLTVSDARGCVSSHSDSVPYFPEFPIQVVSSTIADSSQCTGVAFMMVDGHVNTANYTYSWSNGATLFNTANLCSGWHTVEVTANYNGCTEVDSFYVDVNTGNDTCHAEANATPPLCHGDCNGTMQLTGFSGLAPFNHFWINPSGGGSNPTVSGLCAGSYSLLMIDGSGCMDTLSETITQPDSIQGSFTILYANPNEPCSTLVSLTLVNDNPPSSIYWQCSGETGTQTYACPGLCNVMVQDQAGCTANFIYDVPDSITACSVVPIVFSPTCFGMCNGNITAVANGVPPFNYQWSTGVSGTTIANLCAGVYTVVMTDSVGCVDSATVNLTAPAPLSSSIVSSYLNCQCTFSAMVTGGVFPYTYLWCNNNTAPQMIDCNPGLCSLIVTDANGCQVQDSVIILPTVPLSVSATSTPATCNFCFDGDISALATGGTPPYIYSLQGNQQNTSGSWGFLDPGNYTVCVTDANNCTACTGVTVGLVNPVCSVIILHPSGILCYGDCNASLTAISNGVPPLHFVWSTMDTSSTIDSLCAGMYSVVMTDSVGCIDSSITTVNQPPPLNATYTTIYGCSTCTTFGTVNGGSPPYTYLWCDGSIGNQMFFCGPGVCVVAAVDANGCLIQDTIILSPPPPLTLTVQSTGTTCAGCSNGSIIGSAFGGTPGYTYTLTPAGGTNTTGNFPGLPAGFYQLCVTDANNCTTCDSVQVLDDPTGIENTHGEQLKLFPNPFSKETVLEINRTMLELNPEFIITDILGAKLSSFAITNIRTVISGENMAPGVYLYQLRTKDKILVNGKLVIVE